MFRTPYNALSASSLGTPRLDAAEQMWCVAGVERGDTWGARVNEIPCAPIVGESIQLFLNPESCPTV